MCIFLTKYNFLLKSIFTLFIEVLIILANLHSHSELIDYTGLLQVQK